MSGRLHAGAPPRRSACIGLLLAAALPAGVAAQSASPGAHAHPTHTSPAVDKVQKVEKVQKDWGVAGDVRALARTVTVTMHDHMRFTPEHIEVRQGETLRLVVRNEGKIRHEMVIGSKKQLDDHAAMMLRHPGMAHEGADNVHVAPGKTGDILWHFNRPGRFDFACLIAGHYQAGMRGTITVAAR